MALLVSLIISKNSSMSDWNVDSNSLDESSSGSMMLYVPCGLRSRDGALSTTCCSVGGSLDHSHVSSSLHCKRWNGAHSASRLNHFFQCKGSSISVSVVGEFIMGGRGRLDDGGTCEETIYVANVPLRVSAVELTRS